MQPTEVPKIHSATGVVPHPQPAATWRVQTVEPLDQMRLRVTFTDGTTGEVRLQTFLEGSQVEGSIFEPLRDPDFFQKVRVDLGAVAWPNGADLAPDAMYDAIRADGVWVIGP